MKLNLGCGANKIDGCINIDIEESVNPDVVADFRSNIPYGDNSVDCIYFYHVIEHIEEHAHQQVLREIWRVLKPGGSLFISYPEFKKIAQNYINNVRGKREFWKATIYGRQLYKSDYHVALMDTVYFKFTLRKLGFINIVDKPEQPEDHNTVIKCNKGEYVDYESIVKSEVFDSPSLR